MAIRPNKDKQGNPIPRSWVIDYYPQGRKGKRCQQVVHDVDESEARQLEMELRRSATGGIKNEINPALKDVIPEWLRWMRLHRSPKTVDSIGWALKHLLPHFGQLTVGRITELDILKYKQARKNTPVACNLELDYLKSLIGWMVKRKICNPLAIHIERLPVQRKLPRIPGPEALLRWIEAAEGDGPYDKQTRKRRPGPKNALLWIMVRAGLRFDEAVNLQWQDINFDDGTLYYTAKRGKPRVSILPDEAREILEPIKKSRGLVAPGKDGKPLGNMKSLFKTASRRSGVDIKGPHTLRHICGTYTLEATGDLRLVQETLGHTQIRTTERYTQISLARLRLGQAKQVDYTGGAKTEKKAK